MKLRLDCVTSHINHMIGVVLLLSAVFYIVCLSELCWAKCATEYRYQSYINNDALCLLYLQIMKLSL